MNKKIKKAVLVFLLMLFFSFPFDSAKAGAWGEDLLATNWGIMVEQILKQIQGMIMGMTKQMAVQMITSNISATISGGSGNGSMFITNWNDFLVTEPQQKATLYLNDFFTLSTRGRSSSLNYSSSDSGGVGGSYASQLVSSARNSITGKTPQMNLDQYASSPDQMFEKGNWRAFSSFISNPANNSFGYTLLAQDAYNKKLIQEQDLAGKQAVAYQGYKSQGESDSVTTPGSTIKDIQSQAQDLGNKVLAGASDIPEVITSVVSRMATQTLTQGIGSAQSQAQKSFSSFKSTSDILKNPAIQGAALKITGSSF